MSASFFSSFLLNAQVVVVVVFQIACITNATAHVICSHDYILLIGMNDIRVSHMLFQEVIAHAQFNLVSLQEFSSVISLI